MRKLQKNKKKVFIEIVFAWYPILLLSEQKNTTAFFSDDTKRLRLFVEFIEWHFLFFFILSFPQKNHKPKWAQTYF